MKIPVLYALLMLGLSGCISLKTHEARMKEGRAAQKRLADLEEQYDFLSEEKRDIEIQYGRTAKQQAVLKNEIASQNTLIRTIRGVYDDLVNELKNEIAEGDVRVVQSGDSLSIGVGESILFGSGETVLRTSGEEVLLRVAHIINESNEYVIRVDGHTDNVPVSWRLEKKYPTNWELSAARAAVVVRALAEQGGIEPDRLMLAAFGEYRPMGDNSTEEGRQLNRRVEIILKPKTDGTP